jgi:hypothetical protein
MRVHTIVPLLASLSFTLSQDSVSYDLSSYETGGETPHQSFRSNANVQPPEMLITRNGSGLQSGYVFLGIDGQPDSGQEWPVIFGKLPALPPMDPRYYSQVLELH